jgi:DNA/RNA endonuclease G (NUC1)
MKLIKYLTALLAMMILAVSCGKEKPDVKPVEKTPEIKVTPSEASISAAGGSATLSLFANMDWNVKDVPSWLTVSPESGEGSNYKQTITLSAEANSGGMKEATLTFSIDGAAASVKVKQNHGFSSDAPSNALFFESFTKSKGNFTIKDIDVPSQLPFIWEFSADYKCMKATAYHNASAKNYASESWLISPSIDLPAGTKAYFTFEHAGGYFGKATEEATVWISKNEEDWEQLEIDPKAYPTSWTFISAGNWDMTPYAGSTVQIAFRYSSTATKAGTWEVRNVAILSGQHEDTVIPNVDPKKTDWMELPAMDNDAYGYYSHSFSMKDKVYRNYSFAWSQKDLVSVWMAYPLCKTYTEKVVGRTDAWNYDPILGPELSCAPFSGYAGDYARGHQVPSADRLCCREANEQTFYGTNIIPQLNEHNEGIWQNLENRIREVANASDTTYVVTGCVVEGSKEITTDSDGKNITVPVAYYKAVLRYKKGDADVWTGAAFYTEHKRYPNNDLKAVSMSIDELEEMTGHDFFVNLPGKVGDDAAAAVEAQKPTDYKVWNL